MLIEQMRWCFDSGFGHSDATFADLLHLGLMTTDGRLGRRV